MYYIIFGFLYLFSLLPWRVLYILSDGISFFVYRVIRYRRDVVADNLLIAFPEKTEAERKKIEKEFYKGFIDNFIETIKLFSMSEKSLEKRFVCNFDVINVLFASRQKVQIHSGHFFNWEFANSGMAHGIKYPLVTVYMPISNKYFDRAFLYMRKKFGAIMIPATNFSNGFLPYSKTKYCLGLVGDQNPGSPENAYWTKFFGKLTPIVKGPERTAKIANTAVAMCRFYKVKRGYYKGELVLLTTDPRSLPHGEITRQMMQFVEQSIRNNPSCYLWSHRRWKFEFDEEKYGKLVV